MLPKVIRTMKPPERSHLVLFPGALGDAVCVEPAIDFLARSAPVVVHARGAAAEVAVLFPARPHVRSLDAVEVARLFAPDDDPNTDSWLAAHDRIVSFTGAGVACVVRRLAATGRAVCAPFPRPPLDGHAADLFLRAVTGEPNAAARPPRLVTSSPVVRAMRRLVLLPGSGGRAKRAPAEIFARLARRWRALAGDVTIVLGPAEAGEGAAWRGLGEVVRPESVAALADTLAAASAFVGNDSGPSHVAAALGLAGAVLFTSTEPDAFGPRGPGVVAVPVGGDVADVVATVWRILRSCDRRYLDIPKGCHYASQI